MAPTDTERSRWIALVVLCVGMLMIVLDATVVNVALPTIQADLGFSQSSLAWVVNAYLIAFGGLLLLSGRLGDLIGRRDVFLAGLAVFTLASAACGLANSQEMLVGARFVQGIGGAMASSVILGMIVTLFPEPREQAKAIGVFSFVAAAGGSIGLVAGGVLTELISWHWIFFINLPIGVLTAFLALRLLGRDRGIGFGEGADAIGAVLVTGALMLLVYTIVGPAAEDGWGSGRALAFGAAALAALAGFVAREATARNPLIPLRVFASRNVAGANAVQALVIAGMFGMFFMGALYLQRVLEYDALGTGLAFLPATIVTAILSLGYAEKLITRFGARNALVPGLLLCLGGLVLFTQTPVEADYWTDVMPAMLLLGAGGGVAFPCLMTLSMSGVPPQEAGLASGLVSTTMQVGGALGLAVLATVSAARTDALRDGGEGALAALNGGYHLAHIVSAGLLIAAIGIAVGVLRGDGTRAAVGEPAYSEAV